MATRVFIETTIPSYYFETRTDLRSRVWRAETRQWMDRFAGAYELVTSELVKAEFARSPLAKSVQAARFFANIPALQPPPQFSEIVRTYIAERVMPADAGGDAAHLAMASLHGVEIILTWNCRHLANANKAVHIRAVNDRLGLLTPTIATPLEVIPE